MLEILAKDGYSINLDEEQADIVIINTCSFIHDAEKESVRTIVNLASAGKKIVITGCLAQKYREELMEAVPEALAFVGTGDIDRISHIINDLAVQGIKRIYQVSDRPYYLQADDTERFQITVGPSSYIKIAEGCDYNCSYCYYSFPQRKIQKQRNRFHCKRSKRAWKKGVSEIVLIAQDTTSYGKDIYGKPCLPSLLEKLNEVEEISWIRIMYTYPSLIDATLIKAISHLNKVVKYIDLPLQHSHPKILESMSRPAFDYSDLLNKLRDNIEDIAIRTAFITGFPAEEEEHFEHLYKFIEKNRFDKLGIFEYSREKNTDSYGMKPQIPAKIKKTRRKELMKLQQSISKEINESLIGKKIPAIIESMTSSGKIIGRTFRDAPEIDGLIYIETARALLPGDIVSAQITKACEYDLYGNVY